MIRVAGVGLLALAGLGALGCRRGSEAECLRARTEARKAAMESDLDRASKLLDEARAQCGSNAAVDIGRIQGVIDDRRRAQTEQAEIEARRRAEAERFPVKRMLRWIKLGLDNPELVDVECAPHDSDDFGFCQGHRRGEPKMMVRYWDNQREAFRYAYAAKQPLGCVDAGEHRRVRAWSKAGKSYELCELMQFEARSLSALVEHASDENTIYIFSQEYLQRDRTFAAQLRATK